MFSTRTTNSECNNNQNPFGFHLSDGTIYTYVKGNEYRDVYGAWDWNLIPGTTVDYGATQLACNKVQFKGKESFVGGVALGEAGIAVMNYTNPQTGSLHWSKSYFFFPNTYAVQFVGDITSANKSAPIVTTLDQRQLSGSVFIDGSIVTDENVTQTANRVWHDRVDHRFQNPVVLTVDTSPRSSNWSAIGISIGNETQMLFSAVIKHSNEPEQDKELSYVAELDVDQTDFEAKHNRNQVNLLPVENKGQTNSNKVTAIVRGAHYGIPGETAGDRFVSLAFWSAGEFETGLSDIVKVETDAPILLLFQRKDNLDGWQLAISDPSQTLILVKIIIHIDGNPEPVDLTIELPEGAWAGSTTVTEF